MLKGLRQFFKPDIAENPDRNWLGVAAACTAAIACLLLLSPPGRYLEVKYGLRALYHLRGTRPPPAEIRIVSMDDESGFQDWPRDRYLPLMRRLREEKAALAVFDIHFRKQRTAREDRAFAAAMERAGNVLLYEHTLNLSGYSDQRSPDLPPVELMRLVPPADPFAKSALAVAPFPIHKVPYEKNQCWTFFPPAGEKPTLPVAAFQAFAKNVYHLLIFLVRHHTPDVYGQLLPSLEPHYAPGKWIPAIRRLREIFTSEPETVRRIRECLSIARKIGQISGTRLRQLRSMVDVLSGDNILHLNYYGPPGSIPTLAYGSVLADPPGAPSPRLKDKVVFIGLSELLVSDQRDPVLTFFSRPDGVDLSGVEVLATAFANLLENSYLRPLTPAWQTVLILLWGVLTGLLSAALSPRAGATALGLLLLIYIPSAVLLFTFRFIWLPLVVPAGIAALTWLAAAAVKAHRARKDLRTLERIVSYFVPRPLVKTVKRNIHHLKHYETVYGVVMMTDLKNFTGMSENMAPSRITRIMNRYFDAMAVPVASRDGLLLRLQGDAMLILWKAARKHPMLHTLAAQTALGISCAEDGLNTDPVFPKMYTRVGIHAGTLHLGNIGSELRRDYTLMGDVINTAARIEKLCKLLDTRRLAAAPAVEGLSGILMRRVGTFLFPNKSSPLTIYELVCKQDAASLRQIRLCTAFELGLTAFENAAWPLARRMFHECLEIRRADGPSFYYLNKILEVDRYPSDPEWNGTIRIDRF